MGSTSLSKAWPLEVRGNRWSNHIHLEEVVLHPNQKPKAIDGKSTRGDPLKGIYKIEGDTLTVCWGQDGRPETFTVGKGRNVLIRFERKKPCPYAGLHVRCGRFRP
jgi:hypothetical protein